MYSIRPFICINHSTNVVSTSLKLLQPFEERTIQSYATHRKMQFCGASYITLRPFLPYSQYSHLPSGDGWLYFNIYTRCNIAPTIAFANWFKLWANISFSHSSLAPIIMNFYKLPALSVASRTTMKTNWNYNELMVYPQRSIVISVIINWDASTLPYPLLSPV